MAWGPAASGERCRNRGWPQAPPVRMQLALGDGSSQGEDSGRTQRSKRQTAIRTSRWIFQVVGSGILCRDPNPAVISCLSKVGSLATGTVVEKERERGSSSLRRNVRVGWSRWKERRKEGKVGMDGSWRAGTQHFKWGWGLVFCWSRPTMTAEWKGEGGRDRLSGLPTSPRLCQCFACLYGVHLTQPFSGKADDW